MNEETKTFRDTDLCLWKNVYCTQSFGLVLPPSLPPAEKEIEKKSVQMNLELLSEGGKKIQSHCKLMLT